jgi:hypothetical protein
MGIPYSRQIHSAFDQVTPLVAAGFEVIKTTKNIAILLACLQVLLTGLMGLQLAALLALLVSVNPNLEAERSEIITPAVRHFVAGAVHWGGWAFTALKAGVVLSTAALGVLVWRGGIVGTKVPGEDEKGEMGEDGEGGDVVEAPGESSGNVG